VKGGSYGLILDLDGTLVDSYEPITESLNHARAHYDLDALDEPTVRAAVGHGLESLIEAWVGADRVADGVRLFRERYGEVFAGATRALPGAHDALRTLAETGFRLALASNKPARFSRPILESLGWDHWFSAVEGPDTVGATKPSPAMLLACLASLGTAPTETRYVGDMPLDAISGERAGIEVVLVCGGSATPEALRAAGAPVLDGIADLPGHLNDLGWAPAP